MGKRSSEILAGCASWENTQEEDERVDQSLHCGWWPCSLPPAVAMLKSPPPEVPLPLHTLLRPWCRCFPLKDKGGYEGSCKWVKGPPWAKAISQHPGCQSSSFLARVVNLPSSAGPATWWLWSSGRGSHGMALNKCPLGTLVGRVCPGEPWPHDPRNLKVRRRRRSADSPTPGSLEQWERALLTSSLWSHLPNLCLLHGDQPLLLLVGEGCEAGSAWKLGHSDLCGCRPAPQSSASFSRMVGHGLVDHHLGSWGCHHSHRTPRPTLGQAPQCRDWCLTLIGGSSQHGGGNRIRPVRCPRTVFRFAPLSPSGESSDIWWRGHAFWCWAFQVVTGPGDTDKGKTTCWWIMSLWVMGGMTAMG